MVVLFPGMCLDQEVLPLRLHQDLRNHTRAATGVSELQTSMSNQNADSTGTNDPDQEVAMRRARRREYFRGLECELVASRSTSLSRPLTETEEYLLREIAQVEERSVMSMAPILQLFLTEIESVRGGMMDLNNQLVGLKGQVGKQVDERLSKFDARWNAYLSWRELSVKAHLEENDVDVDDLAGGMDKRALALLDMTSEQVILSFLDEIGSDMGACINNPNFTETDRNTAAMVKELVAEDKKNLTSNIGLFCTRRGIAPLLDIAEDILDILSHYKPLLEAKAKNVIVISFQLLHRILTELYNGVSQPDEQYVAPKKMSRALTGLNKWLEHVAKMMGSSAAPSLPHA
ncbi:unnamed protein product [Amoebophrya sp. A120]|nr:unnamed protein product [Amoebophrya sp. A120]|eukprot:GSA120T00010309001.1